MKCNFVNFSSDNSHLVVMIDLFSHQLGSSVLDYAIICLLLMMHNNRLVYAFILELCTINWIFY